ncbi:uncharacterized protein LOC111068626 [Drosophila obscura]|uniref:uncharacterized protein LOC111068626 n=1 Tax=Drosophila obscura TaxID=7282 RepID=UPI001BB16B40|nr:uncharacterized protein LOC111068626 [Drosophila obscura]
MWTHGNVYEIKTIKNEENIHLEDAQTDVKPELANQRNQLPRNQRFAMALKRQSHPYMKPAPQSREELLQRIAHNRDELSAFFQKVSPAVGQTDYTAAALLPTSISMPSAPVEQRNSYDLFFESACISVKGLPPKLASEAKSRISQIITEFEIRAISEQEAKVEAQARGAAIGGRAHSHPCT